ncbi:HAD-IIB family hydrolase [Nigerium massiliense]|uniref:HAD-IIB family hydrolase n=1 Tax=Nigerium massiliense TaxID=1522317 RepID=UPI000AAB25B5|nr:HAD-IIB family hydrolase [Nigerium massiliense]
MIATPIALVAFDLDDTLAPSKSALPDEMRDVLMELLDRRPVCIISGGNYTQFETQVLGRLPQASTLERLHIMPTNGTQYYRCVDGAWQVQYAHRLTPEQVDACATALETGARELGLWEAKTWGPRIEDRGSQVTFSALGQQAPVDAKKQWDPDGSKRAALRDRVQAELPDLAVHAGGSTSIDITEQGIDKGYGLSQLCEILELDPAQIMFVGDRLAPGGNDYPVLALGVQSHAVTDWPDTLEFLRELIPTLDRA